VGNDLRRSVIAFWALAAAFALLAVAGILVLDRAIAGWNAARVPSTIWSTGTGLFDLVSLKDVSNFLLGPVLLIAGGVLLLLRSTRRSGWIFIYVGAVQFASTIVADLLKPQLGRLRPFEAMANPGGEDIWLVAGNAFPSGHTAFYAGLFFPLMLIYPRWTFLLALPPLFIAAARVLSNDHYLSDVAASLALAAMMTGGFAFIARRAED
jgi:membrane-associated phospholipid phosphatase